MKKLNPKMLLNWIHTQQQEKQSVPVLIRKQLRQPIKIIKKMHSFVWINNNKVYFYIHYAGLS